MRKANLINLKYFLLVAFTSEVLIGCFNTEGNLKIKGKVLDENTKTGIPWKSIIVYGLVDINNRSEPIEAGQFSTDSSGCFSYSFMKVKNARYYNFSMVGDSDYVFLTKTLGLMELEQNAKYLVFSLSKLVDLTIKLNRKSKTPVCDTLRLCWDSDGVYGGSLYPYKIINYKQTNNSFGLSSDRDLMWVGGSVNSIVNTKVFADKRTRLSWELFRNGKRKDYTDTITCRRDVVNVIYFAY
jgi:hypothetical protein